MIILDTDLVSLILRRESALGEAVLSRIDMARRNETVATTIVTYEEQIRGWFKLLAQARTMKDMIDAYQRLSTHLDDFRLLTVIKFDERSAIEFQRLRALKIRVPSMDLKIAAISLANNATLWSRNLLDFSKVPGLRVEDAAR
jgi:tRNA(fMet)-specific endonuclease VapC